jgi:hypothetical protein
VHAGSARATAPHLFAAIAAEQLASVLAVVALAWAARGVGGRGAGGTACGAVPSSPWVRRGAKRGRRGRGGGGGGGGGGPILPSSPMP